MDKQKQVTGDSSIRDPKAIRQTILNKRGEMYEEGHGQACRSIHYTSIAARLLSLLATFKIVQRCSRRPRGPLRLLQSHYLVTQLRVVPGR